MPQCELWSWRGFVYLPDLFKAFVSLRMCDSEEAKVNLLKTWDTPDFCTFLCLSLPQFPVDIALLKLRVKFSCLKAPKKLMSFRFDS